MGTIARGLVVRRPRHGEGRRMAQLYREAFGGRMPGTVLRPRFMLDDSLVATVGEVVVGVGCYAPAGADLDPLLGVLEARIRRIVDPLRAFGEEPPLVIEAPVGLAPVRQRGDRVFTALAVDPDFQRRGVGRALAVGRLALAARAQTPQVFVHCIAGSGSRQLYERLGFVPLVRLARHYRDGSGMTLLYRRLS